MNSRLFSFTDLCLHYDNRCFYTLKFTEELTEKCLDSMVFSFLMCIFVYTLLYPLQGKLLLVGSYKII